MGSGTVLWAGKHLTDAEELQARRTVALMERAGHPASAEGLGRFLPERDDEWTPDELEMGAHGGPWLAFGARAEPRGA